MRWKRADPLRDPMASPIMARMMSVYTAFSIRGKKTIPMTEERLMMVTKRKAQPHVAKGVRASSLPSSGTPKPRVKFPGNSETLPFTSSIVMAERETLNRGLKCAVFKGLPCLGFPFPVYSAWKIRCLPAGI